MAPSSRLAAALALIAALPAAPAHAEDFHDLAAIEAAVSAFAGAGTGSPGGALHAPDPRLRLAACRQPLALEWHGNPRASVRVTCPDPGGWRLFLPLRATAPQGSGGAILVSRRDPLRVEAGGAGFSISRSGEALDNGRLGETIRVRIPDGTRAGRIIAAEIIAPGRVRASLR